MVSWRIVPLLAAALIGSSWLSAQSPLQQRQELRYEGEAKVEIPEKSLVVGSAKVQVLDLVTAAGEGQKSQIASLRVFQFQVQERPAMEAALRFLSITPTGEEEPAPFEQLLAETPPIGFSGQFPVVLPFYFLPREELKEGNAWTKKERALLALEPTGEFRYQVVGKEKIGDKECWVVTRTLQQPIVFDPEQGTQLAKVTDRFWIETATGLVVQAQRQMTLKVQKEQSLVLTLTLNLRGTQKLDDAAFQQRTQQLEAVKSIHKKVGASVLAQPTKESLDEAEKAVTEFLQRYKDSPYAPHVATWQRLIAFVRQQIGKREKQKSLLGQEAPDFELPTVDGRRKVKLSDQRGKVVVLNFFAHW